MGMYDTKSGPKELMLSNNQASLLSDKTSENAYYCILLHCSVPVKILFPGIYLTPFLTFQIHPLACTNQILVCVEKCIKEIRIFAGVTSICVYSS